MRKWARIASSRSNGDFVDMKRVTSGASASRRLDSVVVLAAVTATSRGPPSEGFAVGVQNGLYKRIITIRLAAPADSFELASG